MIDSSCVALGFFDGVHLGHQGVLKDAISRAKQLGIPSVAVTFKNHPRSIIDKNHPLLITTLDEKIKIIEEIGIENLVVLDFDEHLLKLTGEDYIKLLVSSLHPKSITIGSNHHFGSNGSGNQKLLNDLSQKYNYTPSVIDIIEWDEHIISSSAIRKLIIAGEIEKANTLLYKPFTITGIVQHGAKRGRVIGFPTANVVPPDNLVTPLSGSYKAVVQIDGTKYNSVVNIGLRPTYGDLITKLIEAHLFDFNEDIYGKEIEVIFIKKIRDEKKFANQDELIEQIKKDCEEAKRL